MAAARCHRHTSRIVVASLPQSGSVLAAHERGQAVVSVGAVELTFESCMRGFDQSGRNRRVGPSDPCEGSEGFGIEAGVIANAISDKGVGEFSVENDSQMFVIGVSTHAIPRDRWPRCSGLCSRSSSRGSIARCDRAGSLIWTRAFPVPLSSRPRSAMR